jgi:hypothetical protein
VPHPGNSGLNLAAVPRTARHHAEPTVIRYAPDNESDETAVALVAPAEDNVIHRMMNEGMPT